MKYSWIGKKRSLFTLGSYAFLVAIIVILVSFIVSRGSGQFRSTAHLESPSGASQSPAFSQTSGSSLPSSIPHSAIVAPSDSKDISTGASSINGDAGTTVQKSQSSDIGPQYLIKTLKVDLNVKDTRKVADNLLTWITKTDPRAASTGTDYEQVGNNLYNVSLTFSVQATLYPQVYRYLRDYTTHNGGRLAAFNESIQDVTNSYVDTQSRLQNLRVEQGRLQDLLSHAQALSDVLSIDQQLTDVEGQIESDEAQLKTLTSQVTFYTVSVSLEPVETATPPPSNNGWSIGQLFHDAFSTSLAFGQGVLALLVYLVAFSLYVIPLAIIIWLARKWYIHTRQAASPKEVTEINEERVKDSVPPNEEATEDHVLANE